MIKLKRRTWKISVGLALIVVQLVLDFVPVISGDYKPIEFYSFFSAIIEILVSQFLAVTGIILIVLGFRQKLK